MEALHATKASGTTQHEYRPEILGKINVSAGTERIQLWRPRKEVTPDPVQEHQAA